MGFVTEAYSGRYELVDQIGEGAAGAVWRVWDRRQRRYVAAKLLRQRDAGALLRFVREQSLRVAHPHVVAPTGWAAEDHDVLLTMDLVNGGSVNQLLAEHGMLPVGFAADLLDQLLDAVGAVHHAGLVHRDIKPGNLLLHATGAAAPFLRLSDFGIAAVLGEPRLTHVGTVVGTPGYVAPEVWLGADPDPRQDLFAVAAVARQLLIGEGPPATGPLPLDRRPDHVPEPLWEWVRQLADHRPERRPAEAGAARTALRSAMAGCPAPDPSGVRRVFVPDRIGPLPPGWMAPSGSPPADPAPATLVDAGDPGPTAAAAVDEEATQVAATAPPAALVSARRAPRPGRAGRSGLANPWLRIAIAVALLATAVIAFTVALTDRGNGSTGGTGPSSAPVPRGENNAGDPCSFTDAGQRQTSGGGTLIECRLQSDGSYRWRRAG